jgi:hypothetical protein
MSKNNSYLSDAEMQQLLNAPEDGANITNWLQINMSTGVLTLNKKPIHSFTGKVCGAYLKKREENVEKKIPAKVELVLTFAYVVNKELELCRLSIDSSGVIIFKEFVNRLAANPKTSLRLRLFKRSNQENFNLFISAVDGVTFLPLYLNFDKEIMRYENEPEVETVRGADGAPILVAGKELKDRRKVEAFWKDICVQKVLQPLNTDLVIFADAFEKCLAGEKYATKIDAEAIPEFNPDLLPPQTVGEDGMPF